MDSKKCKDCKDLVIMYEDYSEPFVWCNCKMCEVKQIKQCTSKTNNYKNKDP
jgi:hypothetical protein